MWSWVRRVTPDLFLAAMVALVITLALHKMEEYEKRRISDETWVASESGLTVDEGLKVVGSSIWRSTRVVIPSLIVFGGLVIGFGCRHRRWAWLTTSLAVIPAILTGASFYVYAPDGAWIISVAYLFLACMVAMLAAAVRNQFSPARAPRTS